MANQVVTNHPKSYEPYQEKLPYNQGPADNPLTTTTYKKSVIDRFANMIAGLDRVFLGADLNDSTRGAPEFNFSPKLVKAYQAFADALGQEVGF